MEVALVSLTEQLLGMALMGAEWVLWLLICLSVISFAIIVERFIFFFSQGADLDVSYTPVRDFHLHFGISYLHAIFTNFPNAQVFLPVPGGDGRNAPAVVNVTGRRNVRSPDWTMNAAIDYNFRLPDGGSIVPSANIYYSSRFFWTVDNRISEPSHVVINASLDWNLPGDHVHVGAIACLQGYRRAP